MEFEPYRFILKRLNDHGHSAYFVGGCVRDFFLNKRITDVDIATSAPQRVVAQLFIDHDIDLSAASFGVVTLNKPVICQIATYRTESNYQNHRYPGEITFVDDVSLDAYRRDFTVNALYLDKEMTLFDPFNGKDDLQKRILRSIGDPSKRINEDALRILRAVRFCVTLEFEMETELMNACIDCSKTLIYLKENAIELERSKLFKNDLTNMQTEKLEYYRKIIMGLKNYF
jgi:tRNA nucleotidyltransferase (CCA-adding enzyme)